MQFRQLNLCIRYFQLLLKTLNFKKRGLKCRPHQIKIYTLPLKSIFNMRVKFCLGR